MGKIHELGFEIANLIAAGEVVSRPASAIKELVENSIDAGATDITVEIQNGGVSLMRVTDNGCGMEPEDLVLSVKRHATSKIKNEKDLESIMTMGFRGEALASIAAVSYLRIVSKTKDAEYGHMLSMHYGEEPELFERGAATGTTVIAEDLFRNVPARRKFLKRDVVEAGAVMSVVEKLALSHPEIAFCMISDGNIKFETPGTGKLSDVIFTIFGKDVRGKLLPVEESSDGVTVRGYIGSPMLTKVNRAYQYFFVNKRCVSSPMASTALSQAFTSYIPEDRFPFCVLFIKINPLAVDVNVHPAKLEVKFVNESLVFGAIYRACANALLAIREIPALRSNIYPNAPGKASSDVSIPKPKLSEAPAPLTEERLPPPEKRQIDLSSVNMEAMLPLYEKQNDSVPHTDSKALNEYSGVTSGQAFAAPVQTNKPYEREAEDDRLVRKGEIATNPPPDPARPGEPLPENRGVVTAPRTMSVPVNELREPTSEEIGRAVFGEPRTEPIHYVFSPGGKGYDKIYDKKHDRSTAKSEQASDEDSAFRYFRMIGELFNKYVLVEAVTKDNANKFIMIDKHAAHERMLFESLKKDVELGASGSQMLVIPMHLQTGALDASTAKLFSDQLDGFGFKLETGLNDISVLSIPCGMTEQTASDLLASLLEELRNGLRTGDDKHLPAAMERALFTVACKAAIKGGREYPPEILNKIVHAVLTDPKIRFCPHGRPVAFEVSMNELDAMFKR